MRKDKPINAIHVFGALLFVAFIVFVVYRLSLDWPWVWFVAAGLLGLYVWREIEANTKRKDDIALFATKAPGLAAEIRKALGSDFPMFIDAFDAVSAGEEPSMALLQRKLGLTRTQAGRAITLLEMGGVVSPRIGSRPREVLYDGNRLAIFLTALRDEEARQIR